MSWIITTEQSRFVRHNGEKIFRDFASRINFRITSSPENTETFRLISEVTRKGAPKQKHNGIMDCKVSNCEGFGWWRVWSFLLRWKGLRLRLMKNWLSFEDFRLLVGKKPACKVPIAILKVLHHRARSRQDFCHWSPYWSATVEPSTRITVKPPANRLGSCLLFILQLPSLMAALKLCWR